VHEGYGERGVLYEGEKEGGEERKDGKLCCSYDANIPYLAYSVIYDLHYGDRCSD